ncbi:MAG: O-methyltransferase [Anaerolineae bacterium]|nr:O-methyltransferase [Anaerolineae bacterium]
MPNIDDLFARWDAVDQYLEARYVPNEDVLETVLNNTEAADIRAINVAPNQGKMLMLFAQICGAKRILEIGTLAGYSAIWMARALPQDGQIISLEYDPRHADVARKNIALAGFADKVDVRVGLAVDSLAQMVEAGEGPFDFIFIDADKPSNPQYLDYALKLSRPGTVIVADNVVRDGAVIDAHSSDPNVQGVRKFNDLVAASPRLNATAIQTVGSKGYDGFALAIVLAE